MLVTIWDGDDCSGESTQVNLLGNNAELCQNCWDACTGSIPERSFRLDGPGTAVVGLTCLVIADEFDVPVDFETGGAFDSSACYTERAAVVAYCGLSNFTTPKIQTEFDTFCDSLTTTTTTTTTSSTTTTMTTNTTLVGPHRDGLCRRACRFK